MQLLAKTLLASAAAALTLAPLSASALPPDCDVQCVEDPPCSLVCAVPWGTRIITCEKWFNDYELSGTCTPGAQVPPDEEEAQSSAEPLQGASSGIALACQAQAVTANAR